MLHPETEAEEEAEAVKHYMEKVILSAVEPLKRKIDEAEAEAKAVQDFEEKLILS